MNVFFAFLGFLTLGIGCVGIALPILPTTPFFLASALCFAKSSRRLDEWFRGTRLYRRGVAPLAAGRGMTLRSKLRVIACVTLLMAIGFAAMRGVPAGRVCIAAVWVAHIIAFGFFVKTAQEAEAKAEELSDDDK